MLSFASLYRRGFNDNTLGVIYRRHECPIARGESGVTGGGAHTRLEATGRKHLVVGIEHGSAAAASHTINTWQTPISVLHVRQGGRVGAVAKIAMSSVMVRFSAARVSLWLDSGQIYGALSCNNVKR